jgi:FkbM family methyltransferase
MENIFNLVIRIINRVLRPFRYRVVSISMAQLVLEALVRCKGSDVKFIQVGANDGVRFDGLFSIVTSMRWSGLVIEPLPSAFSRLAANYQDHKNVIPLNIALHPSADTAALYFVPNDRLFAYPDFVAGTPSFKRDHLIRYGVNPDDISQTNVECMPLMRIVNSYHLADADYLQIDTEGFDAEIIKMIDFCTFKPTAIKFEWDNLSPREQEETVELLVKNDYHVEVNKDRHDCVAWLSHKIKPA